MNKVLKRDQLVDIRDELFDLVQSSQLQQDKLRSNEVITEEEAKRIGQYREALLLIANDFNSLILRQVIADISKPGERIITVTKDVQAAIKTLESFNDFLGVLASVMSLFTTILSAFTTGSPLMLVNVLGQIEAIL